MNAYYTSRLIMTGGKHRRRQLPGQDHAVVRECEQGAVLVVADGVSLVGGEFSRTEIGSYLASHLACRAAADGLDAEDELGQLKGRVGAALYHGLRGLWTEMPSEALAPALASTLLVAVVTRAMTAIWVSGDGCWGVCAPASTEVQRSILSVATPVDWQTRTTAGGRALVYTGSVHTQRMGPTAVTESRRSPERAAEELRLMLYARGPVYGAWVATDGLADEPEVARRLDLPVRNRLALDGALLRSDRGDDLAVAWAAERLPGLLGLDEVESAEVAQ